MVIERVSNLLSLVNTHNVGLHIVFKFVNASDLHPCVV